jgi:UDP-apiose/xylose synthase
MLPNRDVLIVGFDLDERKIHSHLDRSNFRFWKEDLHSLSSRQRLRAELADADVLINLAAVCNPALYNTMPLRTIRANFTEIVPIVDLCSEMGVWLIHASTSEVYGRTIGSYLAENHYENSALYHLYEDDTPMIMGPIHNQRWTYATAKQLMERYIFGHHQDHGLKFTIVRPLNFFGPRMDFIPGHDGEGVPRVLACFMTALLKREPMLLVDGGRTRRTIVSIHDAVRAILYMVDRPQRAQNQIFNVGNPANEVTIRELALLMRRLYVEITGDRSYADHPILETSSREFYGEGYEDCDRRMPSIDKARSLLGWQPEIGLEALMTETMNYYHEHYGPRSNRRRASPLRQGPARRSA